MKMNQIEGVVTYKEAGFYIRQAKTMLKGIVSLENYIKETKLQLIELEKIAEESGKKTALLSFTAKDATDYCMEYDKYHLEMATSQRRAERTYERIMRSFNDIPDERIKNILWYYYAQGHTLEDTAESYNFSISSISRYKKIGLIKMAERLYGIVIVLKKEAK